MNDVIRPDTAILTDNGYLFPQWADENRWVSIVPFIFTFAIVTGHRNDIETGYEDRWCYHSLDAAITGLGEWAGRAFEGEPQGWHRHPATGRRRPDGDAERQYVNI